MPRTQQDNWEKIPKSARRKNGPAFVRVVAMDNLRAMCARLSATGPDSFMVAGVESARVLVRVMGSGGTVTVSFRTLPSRWNEDNQDNATVFLDILRVGEGRQEKVRERFASLLTCPSLWRRDGDIWETHGETFARLGQTPLTAGRVYCTVCASQDVRRLVKGSTVYSHDSNDAYQLDREHRAMPGQEWSDVCTYCDIPHGNSGPPPDPDAPQPPTPKLDGQDPDSPIDPKALAQMREKGGTWFAYQNEALDSGNVGHLQYLKCGEGCTHLTPPKNPPDSSAGLGWKYLLKGPVDLRTGLIVKNRA